MNERENTSEGTESSGRELRLPGGRSVRYYDTGGAGPTLFWHHGTPQTGRVIEPVLRQALARGIRVVSCARPAYEGTSALPGRHVADAAADVIAVADALGVDAFAVMGASGGGPHAIACAALAPNRVFGAVVFAGVAPYSSEPGWFAGMASPGGLQAALHGRDARARYAETAEFDESSFIEPDWQALAGEWAPLGEDAMRAGRAGTDGEVDDDVAFTTAWGIDVAQVVAPVLLVQGGLDRVVPPWHASAMLAALPNAELWVRPRDGHVSVLRALPVALDWLAEVGRR
ncbi:alpha/beta hydrolase [Microbacterium sp. STN6]|uniref:alpha/beta fold hydrolase n=1 Tax=Microbacterium sp. STN6 TaxID=2995588 RepID=UPI00226088BA|nr:alpha/beta hydrolase [Microbacterium sp. STN6]MCX7522960.1 alpha/beta hydrolase [Microbacterium sp. STN6]